VRNSSPSSVAWLKCSRTSVRTRSRSRPSWFGRLTILCRDHLRLSHIGWAVKVLSENEETGGRGVPDAAKAVAEDLQAIGSLPRYGRLAGKPLSSEIIEQWFYRTDGGYDEQEEANRAYRMQQERMAAKYPDYAAWPWPRRRAWARRYISRLAWSAVFSQTALGKEITSDVI
jgi:hypothetical protein